MHTIPLRVCQLSELPLPGYATAQAAGMDLRASLGGDGSAIVLEPMMRQLVPTGLAIELPSGYEAQVRPRSGLALKHGITVLNSPGTVDADYRGEIKILLINLGKEAFTVAHGDRIAQLVVAPYTQVVWEPVASLQPTERGQGGYGSTGHH